MPATGPALMLSHAAGYVAVTEAMDVGLWPIRGQLCVSCSPAEQESRRYG